MKVLKRRCHFSERVLDCKLKVTVPKGVDTGTELKVKGAGGQTGDGGAGDLLRCGDRRAPPHLWSKRCKSNLSLREIPVTKAILGGDIKLPLLSGKTVTMKIPEGTQNGTAFFPCVVRACPIWVVKAQAIACHHQSKNPKVLSPEQKRLLERAFGKLLNF